MYLRCKQISLASQGDAFRKRNRNICCREQKSAPSSKVFWRVWDPFFQKRVLTSPLQASLAGCPHGYTVKNPPYQSFLEGLGPFFSKKVPTFSLPTGFISNAGQKGYSPARQFLMEERGLQACFRCPFSVCVCVFAPSVRGCPVPACPAGPEKGRTLPDTV